MEVTLRTCQSVPFYACGGFDPSVCAHGFSTRLGGVSPAPWVLTGGTPRNGWRRISAASALRRGPTPPPW